MLTTVLEFIKAHPAIVSLAWPLLTALLTAIFKPQTPEQYAALAVKHPRLADFWRFVGAIGFDPVKAVMVLQQMLSPVVPVTVEEKDSNK